VNAPPASQSNFGLIFIWDEPRGRKVAITGFLLASLVLHALCFYTFQIIYPPAVALLPPPGRVTVIASNTAEGRVLLRWLEAEDPALASTTQPSDQKSLSVPTVQHAPSYLMHHPALKEAPPFAPDSGIPSARPPAPAEPLHRPVQKVTKISPTAMRFSAELETVGTVQVPKMKFSASGHETPQTTRFRIGVGEKGDVRYCFLENSSGDAALDEQARKYLALSRFQPINNPQSEVANALVWGTATIEWGSDLATPPASESVAP
jgi:hypothetical protein